MIRKGFLQFTDLLEPDHVILRHIVIPGIQMKTASLHFVSCFILP